MTRLNPNSGSRCMGLFRWRDARGPLHGVVPPKKGPPETQRHNNPLPGGRGFNNKHAIRPRAMGSFRRLAEQGSEARQNRLHRPRFTGLFPRKKERTQMPRSNLILILRSPEGASRRAGI